MRLGILGGSFNPVHLGHLFLADNAISALKLDRVIFVPAWHSPFKPGPLPEHVNEANANDRLDMLAAAVNGDSRFAIDSCEIRRGGVSYTIITLEDIIARYMPEGKPVLIIGDDLAAEFLSWRESEKILELADIAIARRINSAAVKYPFPHIIIKNDVMNVSSRALRQKISDENDGSSCWRSLVPPGTRAIIEDRQLYGYKGQNAQNELSQAVIQQIETEARQTLSIERFLHSRSAALHAVDLCRRFGADPAAGYLAGIAHDLAKQFDNKLLLKIAKAEKFAVSALEKSKPNLLHGKAAAVLLRDHFCINNKDVLEAVAFHTSGCEDMGQLAKIIYIADKTENTRNIDTALRKLCREADLDSILLAVVERTIIKLKAKSADLSEDTLKLLNRIKKNQEMHGSKN
ncbi:MAG: nicotinate (nicotinamide) nucleotide adenylyltransferase [Treponema sp.]|nr:nicotinate (nicotinamide) nucleotide adenylyltransferase [Treponema sp.]